MVPHPADRGKGLSLVHRFPSNQSEIFKVQIDRAGCGSVNTVSCHIKINACHMTKFDMQQTFATI